MAKVKFVCDCPQSHVGVFIQNEKAASKITSLLFEASGSKNLTLEAATYAVAYRAQGTPQTGFSLKVSDGATMTPVERTLSGDGNAAGVRTLVVA